MKQKFFIWSVAVMTFFTIICSCNNSGTKEEQNQTNQLKIDSTAKSSDQLTAKYQCPMKCEGDKTYAEAGICPECEMDLEIVK